MEDRLKILISSFVLILLLSCTSGLTVHKLNQDGRLPANYELLPKEIIVEKEFLVDTSFKLLYVKNFNDREVYNNFITGTMTNIGGFSKVETTEEMEQYIIQHNLADKISNISDNIGLYQLQKVIGNFLICETAMEHTDMYTFKFHFKIINAANAEILLQIDHSVFGASNLNKSLYNPVFNYYIQWLKKNKQ